MKIVVIGGSGLIGTKLVTRLRALNHEVIAASPSTGVNALSGEGIQEALAGAQVAVDVANSPSFEDTAVMAFFETSSRNLLAAGKAAGVRHHVALSVVGTERMQGAGYFRAKLAQEKLIQASPVPHTIVRATQFFEFLGSIAQAGSHGGTVRLSPALLQPLAAEDVAVALASVVLAAPVNGMVEIAGPEKRPLAEFVTRWLNAHKDPRPISVDPQASYFGIPLDDHSLTPGPNARIMPVRFEDWLTRSTLQA